MKADSSSILLGTAAACCSHKMKNILKLKTAALAIFQFPFQRTNFPRKQVTYIKSTLLQHHSTELKAIAIAQEMLLFQAPVFRHFNISEKLTLWAAISHPHVQRRKQMPLPASTSCFCSNWLCKIIYLSLFTLKKISSPPK